MLRNFKYFIKQGFSNFSKNGAMSVASVVIITACLTLFGLYLVFGININFMGSQFQSQFQIDVYMYRSANEAQIQDVGDVLVGLENVKSVEFVSKEDAFKELEEMQKDNPEILAGYDAVNNNPLPASYRLTLEELADADAIRDKVSQLDGVEKVNTKDDAMDNMLSFVDKVRTISFWMMIILAFISILIISNAIKMTVFSRRKEINIMKFIGATDSFIRSPFIVEGIIVGFVGAILALGIVTALYGFAMPSVNGFLGGIIRLKTIPELLPVMVITFVGFGGILGAVGSWISTIRHLKV